MQLAEMATPTRQADVEGVQSAAESYYSRFRVLGRSAGNRLLSSCFSASLYLEATTIAK